MIVFRTFLKVLKSCKIPILLYTVLLVSFGAFQMQSSDTSANFVASKPDILIINHDEMTGITENVVQYLKKNNHVVKIKNTDQAIKDALFYRDIHYVITIPSHFREDFLAQKKPVIEVKSAGVYQSSFAQMTLERYLNVANTYYQTYQDEEKTIEKLTDTLAMQTKVEITSTLDTNQLSRVSFYYNFANYSILAGCIFVICLVLSSFQSKNIRKRTIVSSIRVEKYNRQLLLANSLFAFVLWAFYVLVSFILLGNIMFTSQGLLFILNSFLFTFCALTIAFFVGQIVNNKDAINGIVNVVALGSSFLCGSFVPMQWLPDSVIKIAHLLPSYYYINNNDLLTKLETIQFSALKPILINMGMVLGFAGLFIILSIVVSKRKQKID